jgi:endonuclease/exonuclease/phosphatase family metal-dependent hydrolase
VIATHLGLRAGERRAQIGALLRALAAHDAPITVVLGDFNHWVPAFRSLRELDRSLGRAAVLRTFPAWRPLLALDRIWVRPATSLLEVHVHATPLARAASDHLPVRATVSFRAECGAS